MTDGRITILHLRELVARTTGYAKRHSSQFELHEDPIIGCILLDSPDFLDDSEFLGPEEVGLSFPRLARR